MKKTLGQKIVYLRGLKDMTQESLAKRMGTRVEVISRWENDHNKPSYGMLQNLAKVLEVSLDELN